MTERQALLRISTAILFAGVSATASPARPAPQVSTEVLRPAIAEAASPIESISPVARDGYPGSGFLRTPPDSGPFPAVVIAHPGLTALSPDELRRLTLDAPPPSRFLAAGYAVAVVTYRSRDVDPRSPASAADVMAAVDYVRGRRDVDAKSVALFGCSGGGDLALEVAAATELAAVVVEEPATVTFAGLLTRDSPRRGERFTPRDATPILANPAAYLTPERREAAREKLRRIHAPLLFVQGDPSPLNRFNQELLFPELRALGTPFEVRSYPGPHCFAFQGVDQPVAALEAFEQIEAFIRRHVAVQPRPVPAAAITPVPVRR
jgi:acetyl esterase/lipase